MTDLTGRATRCAMPPAADDHPIPARVRTALETLFGEPVDGVEVKVRPLYVALHGRNTVATTRRNKIRLKCSIESFIEDPELVLHEYCHVLRQWNTGSLNRRRYLGELARNGYCNNCFEKEARDFAAEHLETFRALLHAAGDEARAATPAARRRTRTAPDGDPAAGVAVGAATGNRAE
jgi:hypothetical protein